MSKKNNEMNMPDELKNELNDEQKDIECEIASDEVVAEAQAEQKVEQEVPVEAEAEVAVDAHQEVDHNADCACEDCEAKKQDEINSEQPMRRKRRRCADILVNKREGLIMFVVALIVVVLCSLMLQGTVVDYGNNVSEQVNQLSTQVKDLELYINGLEAQIEGLENKLNNYQENVGNNKFGFIVNVDGVKHKYIIDPATNSIELEKFDTRPFFGVGFYEVSGAPANPIGLQVDHVYQHSPAELAGIKAGDILISVNGVKLSVFDDLSAEIEKCAAEDTVDVQFATATDEGIKIVTAKVALTYRGNFALED